MLAAAHRYLAGRLPAAYLLAAYLLVVL